MKRRGFLKNSAIAAGSISMAAPLLMRKPDQGSGKTIMEWRVYYVSRNANSRNRLNQYFTVALKPFLEKRNVQFALFSEYSKNEPVVLYVLIAYPDIASYMNCLKDIQNDPEYLKASEFYRSIPVSEAVYNRFDTYLLEAFDNFNDVKLPVENKGLYEKLRLYESAFEEAGFRKITMFNKEEIAVFLKTGINPVFFGKILAGQHMPALLYLVAFKDMAERDAAWAKFSQDPDWITMRDKPEYANTVSNIHKTFLLPETL